MLNLKDTSKPRAVLTVSELTAQIRFVLEDYFDQVAVVGEVSNAKVYPSGHWYFSLKDQDATLPCVSFKSSNQHIKFDLEDGLMVVARGKLSVYPPRGAYQMVVSSLEPVGIGEWQLAFEQLRQKLELEGLLDPARKRAIPFMPRRIGIVTSLAGAALQDILTALKRRNRNVNVVLSPAKVQGEGSAAEIAHAIKQLEELGGLDVILVCRGGGSIEDLWSFNTEIVARAVAGCSIPVISGVGHETDVTICDLVADLRAPTPTAAAELVAKGQAELITSWVNLNKRMVTRLEKLLLSARRSVERLSPLHTLRRYQERLKRFQLRAVSYKERIVARMGHLLAKSGHKWSEQNQKLAALGPLNVLGRGFSILRKINGEIVRDASHVNKGDMLEALLAVGRLQVKVEVVEIEPGTSKLEGGI